jgi:2-C-methyl-D-erythritol 4-phosphate cytidylyltransferase/2-C-methyl-D-erythritol 4-phosphate cytidylyltransferase/2-C-methyl-D-erythritol 2,4-cyclodiphosphate synthase
MVPAGVVFSAIITAAGSSTRMCGRMGGHADGCAGGLKKEYRTLPESLGGGYDSRGKPLTVLGAAVSAFAFFDRIGRIVITVPADPESGEYAARRALPEDVLEGGQEPRILFVPGGKTRRESVHHALSLLAAYDPSCVLIHDGNRPWISVSLINAVMEAALEYGAVIPALPLTETPKELDLVSPHGAAEIPDAAKNTASAVSGFIRRHLRRSSVFTAQTPQAFSFPAILAAHEKAAEKERDGFEYTDDAEIWGEFHGPVAVIPGEYANKKITFPADLETVLDTEGSGAAEGRT